MHEQSAFRKLENCIVNWYFECVSTGHGVIQGYNGIAAVDDKHQVIMWAEAFGDSNKSGHLPEILEGVDRNCKEAKVSDNIFNEEVITADSGFHSEKNMEMIDTDGITAFIADNKFRKRDVRFSGAGKYIKKVANWQPERGKKYFTAKMIRRFDTPEGRSIYRKTAWSEDALPARLCNLNGYSGTSVWTFKRKEPCIYILINIFNGCLEKNTGVELEGKN